MLDPGGVVLGRDVALEGAGALAAWTSAVLTGRTSPDAALDALQGPPPIPGGESGSVLQVLAPRDETAGSPAESLAAGYAELLRQCRANRTLRLWCVAAEPGNVAFLPGPAALNAAAAEAGAAVLIGDASYTLIPTATRHGPVGDRVWVLTWRWLPCQRSAVGSGRPAPGPRLAEADASLLSALADATELLQRLDVASSGGPGPLSATRRPVAPVPPGSPERAQHLLDRALRVLEVVRLAGADQGASTTSTQVVAREAALRSVASSARVAVATAWNACAAADPSGRTG